MARRIPIRSDEVVLTDTLSVPVRPMIGCIGTAPAQGTGSTIMPSYSFGGNMDLTDAAPGSTVHLPVEVDGALLSIGDLHAIMARGESSFVAIEAQGTAIVSVDLIKNTSPLRAPRIETDREWIFVGSAIRYRIRSPPDTRTCSTSSSGTTGGTATTPMWS